MKILITGVGAPGAPGIIKSLRKAFPESKILGVDINQFVSTRLLIDSFFVLPSAESDNFLDVIKEVTIDNGIDIIIPLVTKELSVFSKNKKLFEKFRTKVAVMDDELLSISNDKLKLLNYLSKHQIFLPQYFEANDFDEILEACHSLNYNDSPIVLKPSVSNGSRGFRILDNPGVLYSNPFLSKPNNLLITLSELETASQKFGIPNMILMEYLPGDEYSVDIFSIKGKAKMIVPRKRIGLSSGISTEVLIEKNSDVINYCSEICKALGLDGVFGIQVKYSSSGVPAVLEINPRLQGTVIASVAAGINFPAIAVQHTLKMPVDIGEVNWGLRMVRYWEESYFDIDNHPIKKEF